MQMHTFSFVQNDCSSPQLANMYLRILFTRKIYPRVLQIATLSRQVKNAHYFFYFPTYFSLQQTWFCQTQTGGDDCCCLERLSCGAGLRREHLPCIRYGTRSQQYSRKQDSVESLVGHFV